MSKIGRKKTKLNVEEELCVQYTWLVCKYLYNNNAVIWLLHSVFNIFCSKLVMNRRQLIQLQVVLDPGILDGIVEFLHNVL